LLRESSLCEEVTVLVKVLMGDITKQMGLPNARAKMGRKSLRCLITSITPAGVILQSQQLFRSNRRCGKRHRNCGNAQLLFKLRFTANVTLGYREISRDTFFVKMTFLR